jgi:hypothetical protein
LIEKYELAFHSEQFRILTAQALFQSTNINACINVLEKNLANPLENEVLLIQQANGTLSAVGGGLAGLSSVDEIGAASAQNTVGGTSEELNYYRGLRFLLLARAYESQENKIYAVQFYKEALRYNAANFEAFNRLVANHLLTREEKRSLLEEGGALAKAFEGKPEDLWLKDYYHSRIE